MLTEWLEIFGLQTPSKPWAEEQKHADASSVGMLTGWYENLRAKLSSNEDPRVELEPQWFEVFGYKSSEGESLPLKPTKEDYFALDDYFTFWSSTFGIIVLITLFLACWQVLRVKKKYKNKQDEEVSSATQETCRRQRRKRPESRCLHYSAPSHDCAKYLERDNHLPLGCVESSELSKREPPGKNAEELYDHYHFWCDDLKTTAKEKLVKVLPFNHTDSCNHNDCVLCQDASSISESLPVSEKSENFGNTGRISYHSHPLNKQSEQGNFTRFQVPVADIVPELKPSLSPNVKLSSPSSRFAENENFSISSERTLSAVGITDNTSYAVGTQVVELYPCYVAPHLTQEVTHNSPLYASTSYSCNEGTSEMLHSSSLSELSSSFSKKERLYSSVASSQASSQSMSCLFCDDSSSDLSDYSDIVPTKSQSVLYVSPESANFSMTTETTKKQYNLSKKKKFTTSYTLSNSYHLMHCSDHSAKQKPGVNVYSRVSPITYLSKEQLHKIEVLQLKKILHLIFGIPPVVLESQTEAKMLAEARKKQEQGIQMEIEILTSDVLVLSPGQVQGLEHNVAKKALEITWGIPDIIRQSIELFKPPPPLLHKKKVKPVEITIEEVDSPVLTKNQIHSLEFNIKRKNVQQQWGLPTVIQKSLIMFIPLAPPIPLPRLILPGLGHKIVTTQLSWLDWDITSAISYNLKQKKLQHQWGLPKRVQESLDMLMPPHPFIMKKVVKKPFRDIIIVRPEIPESLLGTKLLQKLERNVKLKIIYKRWGLPLVIKDSFFNFIPPAPPVNYFIKCEKEKKLQKFNRMLQTQLLKPHAKEVQHIDKTTSCMPLMFLQKQKYKYLAFGHQASQQQKTNTETNTIMEYEKPNSLRQLLASGQDSKKALSGSWEETLIFLSPSTRDNDIKAVLSKETIMTVIKNLETYIIQKTFDVKLTIPHMIQKSINSTHKEGKKPSRNSIQYDCSYTALTVLEQDNIDKLDLHLKRKIIEQHWGLPPFVLQSLEQYIPKTSAHPVLTSRREDIIEHTEMPTPFISLQARKHLEFHIKKKMLQQQWGLPVAIQKSLDTFMPPAPGIPCKKDVHQYTIITKVSDLHFLSRESKEYLENNIKRKIINWWWGLPELIQASIDDFILKPPPIEKCDLEYEIKRKTISKISSIFMKDLGKKHFQSSLKQYFLNRVSVPGYIRSVKTCIVPSVIKECLDFHLVRKNHEIRIKQFPKRVRNSYKTGCPPAQKKSLPKLITNGNGFRKLRPEWIFFMEQDAVSRIKMNLMHKHLQNLFGLSTLHTMSLEMMIPKPSPLQLTLKARRAIIEFTAMEIPFISDKVRDHLEWHTKQKSLQSNWGLPFLVLKSVEAFIPPAPKLTIPMLRTVSQGDVIVLISKLEFINENTVEELETNVMKKINNIQLGHPKLIENSLRQFIPPPPPLQGGFLSTSEVYDTKLYQPLTPHFKLILRRKQTIKFADQTQLQSNYEKINIPLAKNSVETQSNMILKLVKTSYNSPYPSLLKKTLPNLVASDKGFRKSQTDSVLLTEQVALDHIDVNMKHKNLNYLFGLPTLYSKSMEFMIPKAPPPSIASRAMIKCTNVETPFVSNEERVNLEKHIDQKKTHHHWVMPFLIKETLDILIPPAPKLVLTALQPRSEIDWIMVPTDLPLINQESTKSLKNHVRKKTDQQRCECPKHIQASCRQRMSVPPPLQAHTERKITAKSYMANNKKGFGYTKNLSSRIKTPITLIRFDREKEFGEKSSETVLSHLKNEDKKTLDLHLTRKCIEIQIDMIPMQVKESFKRAFPQSTKKLLPTKLQLSKGIKRLRVRYTGFIALHTIDHIEMNIKQKHLQHLWGFPTPYAMSMALMIPKAPHLSPPLIKANGAKVQFMEVETPFFPSAFRDVLEWHIKQKRLQQNWGIPLLIQKPLTMFIPPAPKLVLTKLQSRPEIEWVLLATEISHISEETSKKLEYHIKKKIIQQKWGLPQCIQNSLRQFMPPESFLETYSETKSQKNFNLIKMPMPVARIAFISYRYAQQMLKRKKILYTPLGHLKTKIRETLNLHVTKKCLEIKMNAIPKMFKESFKVAYPSLSKKSLPQLIEPGRKGIRKPPGEKIMFIEQSAVDRIEMNLKHKQLHHLWEVSTLFAESVELMISEALPVPKAIKESGAMIEMKAVEIPFISNKIRENLEWHIKKKTVQHNWGIPMFMQKSLEAFIAPCPKLILTELKPKMEIEWVMAPTELSFVHQETTKKLEYQIRKKIVQKKWGLPQRIQHSLNEFIPQAPPLEAHFKTKKMPYLHYGKHKGMICLTKPFLSRTTIPLLFTRYIRKITENKRTTENTLGHLKNEVKQALNLHLARKGIEIQINLVPKWVKESFLKVYPSFSKKPLHQLIQPRKGVKRPKVDYILFIEHDAVCRLEMNMKQKYLQHLWGLPTLYMMSMELMVAKPPPTPATNKTSGVVIESTEMESPFVSNEVRERFEWHVKQKTLHQEWGIPLLIKKSLEEFIPPAPELVVSELKFKQEIEWVMPSTGLPFISLESRKQLEHHTKKKIVHQKWGLPWRIQNSIQQFTSQALPLKEQLERKQIHTLCSRMGLKPSLTSTTPLSSSTCVRGKLERMMTSKSVLCFLKSKEKDILNHFLKLKCLEIQMNILPKQVKESFKAAYPLIPKKSLPKLVQRGHGIKKSKAKNITLIGQEAINLIDFNLRHKHLQNLWGLSTLYMISQRLMIPKAPPPIKANGDVIEFSDQETPFISDEVRKKLEWHIKLKKLQNCSLPLLIQKSFEAVIPLAPLLDFKLTPKLETDIIVITSDLPFVCDECKKKLDFNIKKKIIQKKWGIPKRVQESLSNFIPPPPTASGLSQANSGNGTGSNRYLSQNTKRIRSETSSVFLAPKELGSTQIKGDFKTSAASVFDSLNSDYKEKLNMDLAKKNLEIKMELMPKIVMKSIKLAYPVMKAHLPKLTLLNGKSKRARASFIPFMEIAAVHQIEFNIKHKHLQHLWGFSTLYNTSINKMIAKSPPLLPLFKSSGSVIEMTVVETPFISKEVREHLEWHIKQKKLQHNWGLPSLILTSLEAFIPPAPKLKPSQINLRATEVHVINEMSFISDEARQKLEFNVKRKIVQKKWGIPKRIQESLQNFIPPLTSISEQKNKGINTGKTLYFPENCESLTMKKKSITACRRHLLEYLSPENKDKLELHLAQKSLEIKMQLIPSMVKTSYKTFHPVIKAPLLKAILLGSEVTKSKTTLLPFMEEVIADLIELSIKHKHFQHLWGFPTLYTRSTEMMIPKTPPPIKRSGAMMEFEDMDIPFISSEVREKLELHIEQKKLQHNWGLPSTEQNTLQTCVSPTPKLIPVQLNPMATFDVLPTCNDLPFISENTREMLEMHLESKKSHKRLGLPILIQNSLNQFIPSAYVLSKNDSGNGKEKIGPIELPPNPLPYKYMTWRNSLSRQSSKTKVIRMSTVDEGTVAKPNLNPIVEGPNFVKDKEKPNFMEHNKANGDTTLASNVVPSLKLIEKLQNGTKTAATAAKVPAYKIANYCQDWVKDTIPITQPPLSQMTQIPNDLQTAMVSYCFQYITPRPDANDIQQIRETLELYFDKKKRMTDLLYLPPLVVSSIKLSKPPPAPFLPITLSQRSTVCNAVVPNFIIPQTLYDLTVVLDIHIRKKLLEVDLGIPALVEDSINLAKPSPAPKLGAKIRRIYLEEDFDVREMYNCMSTDMIQYNRTLSGIEDASHFGFLPPVETMIPSKEVIMEELEFHFKKKIISESLNFPYPGNTILAPELPSFLKHNHCTCLDYPYSPAFLSRRHAVQSQLIPYLMPKISDLITAKGSSTLGSQHNFDFQQQLAAHVMKKHTELNTSNVPPCVIASRRTYGESLLISQRTPRYSYPPLSIHRQSFGPSIIRTSIFLLDTALKKNINMHLKQKLIMSTAFLPQCVIESQTIYNAMITQRIRKAVRHLRMRLSAELQRMQDLDKKLKCDKEVLQTIWNTDELNSTALSSLSTFDCSPQNTKPFFSCKRREFALNEDKLQDIRQEHFKEKYCNSRSPNMECRYGRAIHCKTLFQALKPHRFITQSKAKILTKNQRNEHNTAVRHDFHKTRSTVGYCKPGALRNIHTSENDEFSDHSSQFTTEYESETFTEADEEATVMHCSKAHHSTVSQKLIGIEPPKMPALGRSCQSSKSVTFSDTIDIQQIRNETSMDEDALFLVSAKTSSLQANNRNETQSTTRDKVARKSAMSTSVQKTTHSERERQKKMELTQKEVSVSVNEDDQWKHFYKNNVKEDAHKKAVSPGTMYKYIENKIDVSQQSAALFSATMETENFLPNIGDAKEKLINVNSSAVNDSFFREQSNSMHNNWNENKLSGNAASRKGSTVQQSAIVIAEKGSVESSTATVNEKAMTRQYSATMGERGSVRWSSVSTDESTSTEQYPDTLDETGSAEEFIPTTNGKVTTRETPITTTSASTTNEESFAEEYISTSSGIQSSYTSREESLTDKTTSRKPPGARNVRRDQSIKRQLLSRSQKTSRKCDSVRYCPSVNRSRSMSMHRRQKSDETDSEVSQYSNPPSKVRSNEICRPRNRVHHHITREGVVSEAKFHFTDQATHCPRAVMNFQKRRSCDYSRLQKDKSLQYVSLEEILGKCQNPVLRQVPIRRKPAVQYLNSNDMTSTENLDESRSLGEKKKHSLMTGKEIPVELRMKLSHMAKFLRSERKPSSSERIRQSSSRERTVTSKETSNLRGKRLSISSDSF
nr:PREDICTED: uncharacterized protein LOC106703202 [Latimeria chalumnae]|eukprot:XP_014342996.1 PREDICTED: uncharacterized protein LOC106703202 [Latimeria chalumnae]